jgi:cobalt-zinc-cadmium efflux system outer membrane protein
MTRITCIALAAVLTSAPASFAQEMTVEELVAIALEQSPDLEAARAQIAAAAGRVTQAGLRPNPTIAGSHEQGTMAMKTTTVGVEWPLALYRRPARAAVARSEAEIVSLSVRDRERLLASAVREQAGRLLAARRTLDIASEALGTARRLRDLLDRRVIEGGSTQLDANLAAVEVLRLEADVALATGDVQAATIELRAVAGLPADAPLMMRDTLEGLAADPVLPRLTPAAALEARPDIREAIAQIGVADARIDAARREARTDLTLVAGYMRARQGFDLFAFDHGGNRVPIHDIFHTVMVGARLTMPWFDRNQGTITAAQAERAGAETLVTARQRAARAEIDASLARERETRRAVALYGGEARALAQQNVAVMLEGYDLGRFLLSDVLTEQRRYLDVEAGYTEVLTRAYEARTAVARAFGEIP